MKFARFPFALMLACLFIAFSKQLSFASCSTCAKDDRLCGPKCVLLICQKFGIDANLDELTSLCGTDEQGSTLAGLSNAAKAKGLEAVGMKISVDDLGDLKVMAIAHEWGNHFVIVEPGNDARMLDITDPPHEPVQVSKENFKKVYSGFALLISKDKNSFPESKQEGADLRLDIYIWDFGSLYKGDKAGRALKIRNVGNEDLAISRIESSCDCLQVGRYPEKIPSGGEAEVNIAFDSADQQGAQDKKIYITSNDPISPVVQFQVTGIVKSPKLAFSPRSVDFGDVRKSMGAVREVFVYTPSDSDDKIQVTKVYSDSPFLTATFRQSKDQPIPGCVIAVSLKPVVPPGEFKGAITIESTHTKDPVATVPVTANIKGDINLSRDTFFFGLVKQGNEKKSTITITTVGKSPLKIEKIDNPLDYILLDLITKTVGKEYTLTATLKGDAPKGYIKSEVVIHTNDPDQPEIKVPVYALIEE